MGRWIPASIGSRPPSSVHVRACRPRCCGGPRGLVRSPVGEEVLRELADREQSPGPVAREARTRARWSVMRGDGLACSAGCPRAAAARRVPRRSGRSTTSMCGCRCPGPATHHAPSVPGTHRVGAPAGGRRSVSVSPVEVPVLWIVLVLLLALAGGFLGTLLELALWVVVLMVLGSALLGLVVWWASSSGGQCRPVPAPPGTPAADDARVEPGSPLVAARCPRPSRPAQTPARIPAGSSPSSGRPSPSTVCWPGRLGRPARLPGRSPQHWRTPSARSPVCGPGVQRPGQRGRSVVAPPAPSPRMWHPGSCSSPSRNHARKPAGSRC